MWIRKIKLLLSILVLSLSNLFPLKLGNKEVQNPIVFVCPPLINPYYVSDFGEERTRSNGRRYYHQGIDQVAQKPEEIDGAWVQPVDGGTVFFAGTIPGYGNTVIIDHGTQIVNGEEKGYMTLYAHLKTISPLIKEGDKVNEDTVLGLVGGTSGIIDKNSGREIEYHPHLHYESHYYHPNDKPKDWKEFTLPSNQNRPIEERKTVPMHPGGEKGAKGLKKENLVKMEEATEMMTALKKQKEGLGLQQEGKEAERGAQGVELEEELMEVELLEMIPPMTIIPSLHLSPTKWKIMSNFNIDSKYQETGG